MRTLDFEIDFWSKLMYNKECKFARKE